MRVAPIKGSIVCIKERECTKIKRVQMNITKGERALKKGNYFKCVPFIFDIKGGYFFSRRHGTSVAINDKGRYCWKYELFYH